MIQRKLLLALALTALLAALPLTGSAYWMRLGTLGAIFAILALGLSLTAGHVGLFDFGYIVYFGIGGYTTAILTVKSGVAFLPALLASIALSAAFGAFIGLVVLRLRGPYFVIATFSFLSVVYYGALNWSSLTNGPLGLIGVPAANFAVPPFGDVDALQAGTAFELALAGLVISGLIVWRLTATSTGRAWHAIRDNEELASSVGIAPARYAFVALVVSAALGGLAGSLYAQYLGIVTPEIFAFGHMVDVLLMIVIGGTASLLGPIFGAFLVIILPELLRVAENWRLPIYGLILIALILFAPRGLAALVPRGGARWRAFRGARLPQPAREP